jgi:hypothetical protein
METPAGVGSVDKDHWAHAFELVDNTEHWEFLAGAGEKRFPCLKTNKAAKPQFDRLTTTLPQVLSFST